MLWRATGSTEEFDDRAYRVLRTIVAQLRREQRHEDSPYRFERAGAIPTETLARDGRGKPVAFTAAEAGEEKAAAARSAERAEALAEKLRAVERSVNTDDYQQILADLQQQRDLQRRLDGEEAEARTTRDGLQRRIGELGERRQQDAAKRDGAVEVRDGAAARFRTLATGTLADDSAAELTLSTTDGVTATLRAAQSVAAKWPSIPHEQKNVDDALHRLNEMIYETRDVLGARAELELSDDEVRCSRRLWTASG